MPYLKRINSLPLINHISYKYAQVSDIGPSWSSCLQNKASVLKLRAQCRNREPYSGVKLTMKKSCNNYTNDKSKHKMCWEGILLCQGMPKLHHLQTIPHMSKFGYYDLLQTRKNQGLLGKGIIIERVIIP